MRPGAGGNASGQEHHGSAPGSAPSAIEVEISDTQGHLTLDPEHLAELVRRVLAGEGVREASISIALVDDATIHKINREHLSHNWPTDVISFRFSDKSSQALCGELVFSAERAVWVAGRVGIDPWAELALYVVHGLLHLCGYDDVAETDREAMRRREEEVLAREGLTNAFPLFGRAEDGERGSGRWADSI